MHHDPFCTPQRRKTTAQTSSQRPLKFSTVQSSCPRDSRYHPHPNHQQLHHQRRESRLNSLMRIRKDKLQEITGENQKIFMRLNQQSSHYTDTRPLPTPSEGKENSAERLGPIGDWHEPTCFILGDRGIMCEQRLGVQNMLGRGGRRQPQSLGKSEGSSKAKSGRKTQQLLLVSPNRQSFLPDIYMMI